MNCSVVLFYTQSVHWGSTAQKMSFLPEGESSQSCRPSSESDGNSSTYNKSNSAPCSLSLKQFRKGNGVITNEFFVN